MNGNRLILFLAGFLALVVIAVGGSFYYLTQIKNKQLLLSPSPVPEVSQGQMKNFQNTQYKFSLDYPASWGYKENDPSVPNLAEYTVTFFSPDQNTVLDVWIKRGNWADVEQEMLKVKDTSKATVAGQPAIIQLGSSSGKVVFVRHPFLSDKVLVFLSMGDSLGKTDQILKTLKFL